MKKIITAAALMLTLISSISFGQLVTKVLTYNGPGNQIDKCTGITQDNFGYVYATGVSWGSNSTKEDYATIKFGQDGDFIWAVRYDGPGHNIDNATAITIDNAGNVYVTGWSRSGSDYGSEDYCTIKYNNNGQQLWAARYDGAVGNDCYYYDYANAIVVDNSGNVYVTGESWGNDNLNGDYLTVKYNSNGVVQWAKRYNGPSCKNDKALSIGLDAMNNVYVTGASEQQGKGYDYVTVKYSTNGSQQWAARYDGPAYLNDIANELKVDGMGNVYVTGSSHGGTSKLDYTTIKYNSAGQQQWLKRYTNSPINDTDVATGIDIDVYGNAYVTGYSKSSGAASYDYVTIKYKGADGTQMWLNRADGGLSDKAWDIKVIYKTCVSSQGSLGGGNDIPCWDVFVYVSGESKLGSGTDFLTYGYGENGNQRWFNRFNGPQNGNDAAYSISVKANYPVIYAGGVFANDYGVIGIIELTRNGSSDFKGLSSNYPNPFNPSTNISYNITKESSVRINVFDILGRNVAKLVDEKKPEGTYSVTFDASDLNSGIYFYRIETEYASETKKIVLIK
ncbi:MAG TPA: SBBP repeat-containing protein [Ignavibacteria bacterium]|nr:SBBP repeat-containing protein [Ignavibacteria bacterium]